MGNILVRVDVKKNKPSKVGLVDDFIALFHGTTSCM